MKPIYLEMSAFGPYKNVETVDFRKLGDHGIFLITGETGAGKTTIFDAIKFALYGESSGGKKRRAANTFRSDYAEKSSKTYVIFEFEHNGEVYQVKRVPSYIPEGNKNARGAEAELVFSDGRAPITKNEDVTAEIKQIIGLDKDQFDRSIMIAQGDFMKILHSSSDERTDLFRKIFHTELFKNVKDVLASKNSEAKNRYETATTQVKTAIESVRLPEDKALPDDAVQQSDAEAIADLMEDYLKEIDKCIKDGTAERDKLDKQIKECVAEETAGKALNDKFDKLDDRSDKLKKLDDKKSEMDAKREKLAKAEKAQRVERFDDAVQTAKKNFDGVVKKKKKAEDDLPKIIQKAEQAEATLQKAEENSKEVDALKAKITELNKIPALLDALAKAKSAYDSQIESYKKEQQKLDDLSDKADDLQKLYFAGQAGILASELTDGMPCPVCGSTEHPKLALLSEDTPSKEKVDEANKRRDEQKDKAHAASVEAGKLKTVVDEKTAAIEEMGVSTEESSESANQTINELQKKVKCLDRELKAATKARNDAEQKKSELDSRVKTYAEQEIQFQSQLDDANKAYIDAIAENEFENEEAYLSAKLALVEQNELKKQIEDYDNKRLSYKSVIESVEAEVAGKTRVDVQSIAERHNELQDKINKLDKILDANKKTAAQNAGVADNLRSSAKQWKKAAAEFTTINDLYRVVGGDLNDKDKLMLETFVQQHHFRRVIVAANERLDTLSNGIFSLHEKEEASNKQSKTGLELEIYDVNTGKMRDVKTLSGGESFMASLSLALGLSDVVGSESGADTIESMFIDEGFGSLDENALQRAVGVLETLSDSSRLIGIISHVSELKERIDKKIMITKTANGSTLRTEI